MMTPRRATPSDAPACAAILNAWIDATPWMPRIHSPQAVADYYRNHVLPDRTVWVDGQPVAGFLALDPDVPLVTALYVARPGKGTGRRLLDRAKTGRARLQLWTFQANARARAFYAREGFAPTRSTEGDNEEGLPDILMTWEAAA